MRHDPQQRPLPLVAAPQPTEVINRRWYDLTNSHPEFAPPSAVEFVRQWEAAARERLREREERKSVHA
jgi:hypothetical protein